MTLPTNVTLTYTQVGIREDLENVIYNISPIETPFFSMAARSKATQTKHEWQTDSLASAATNVLLEGDDASFLAVTATTRVNNYCQILGKAITVSGTASSVNTAGRKDELAYQIAKRGQELKRDIENALTTNQGAVSGTTAAGRQLASTESWMSTNLTSIGGGAGATVGFSGGLCTAPVDGTQTTTVSEANLKAILQAIWTSGGQPDIVLVGPKAKAQISKFAGIATQYRNNPQVGQATIIAAAGVYVSDFGEVKIVPSRFSRDRTVQVFDMEYWGVAYLRPFQQFELSKTGDAEKRMMLAELTLVSKNQAASGKIADLLVA